MVVIGRRIASGPFVATWTVPLAIVVLVLMVGLRWTAVTTALSFSLAGLIVDILGVITRGSGLILSRAAHLRHQGDKLTPQLLGQTAWARLLARGPVAIAKRLGPADSVETAPTVVQELVDAAWGLVLLIVGFILQALGTDLQWLGPGDRAWAWLQSLCRGHPGSSGRRVRRRAQRSNRNPVFRPYTTAEMVLNWGTRAHPMLPRN